MAREAQTAANRRNAAASSGPKSAEGKARASRNAEKHGLLADDTVITGESPADFIELLEACQERFQPEGTLEDDFVAQLATVQWRLGRAARLETAFCDHTIDEERQSWLEDYEEEPQSDQDNRFLVGAALVRDARRGDTLSRISRYEMRLTHRFNRALSRLAWLQAQRVSSTRSEVPSPK